MFIIYWINIIFDKAYASLNVYNLLDKHNIDHIIPPRKNMKLHNTSKYDKNEYIKRINFIYLLLHL